MEIQFLPTPTVDNANVSAKGADKEQSNDQKNFNSYLDEKITYKENKSTTKNNNEHAATEEKKKPNKTDDELNDKSDKSVDPLIVLVVPTEKPEKLISTLPYLNDSSIPNLLNQETPVIENESNALVALQQPDSQEEIVPSLYKGDATDLLSDMKDTSQDTEIEFEPLNKVLTHNLSVIKKKAEIDKVQTFSTAELQSLTGQQKLSNAVQETGSSRFVSAQLKMESLSQLPKPHNNGMLFSLNNLTAYQGTFASPASAALTVAPQSHEWQDQFQQQILLFNKNQIKEAELRLHPADLGSIQIKMKIDSQQAHFQFMSMHESVNAVIKQALPDLKQALLQQGIDLTSADVLMSNTNSFSFSQQQADHRNTGKESGSSYSMANISDKLLNNDQPNQRNNQASTQHGVSIFI